jgi:hypothetical protein
MPNIKFSDFTFEAPNGTAQLVGYRSTVNFRSSTTSLAGSLGTADLVDLTSEQEVTGSKLFTSTLMLGESSAASMSGVTLYSNSSDTSYWVLNSRLEDDLKAISFRSNNSARWEIAIDGLSQDLSFNFYNDAGVLQTSALYLSRASGEVRMTQSLRLDVNLRVDNNSVVLSNAELQRLSGVSSNIQTQLNSKQDAIPTDDITKLLDGTISFRSIADTDVPSLGASKFTTGTFSKTVMPRRVIPSARTTSTNTNPSVSSEVVLASLTIPSGTLSVGDIVKVNAYYALSTISTKTPRIRVAATAVTTGTNNIAFPSALGASVALAQFEGIYVITGTTTMRFAATPAIPYGLGTAAVLSVTIPNITSSNIVFSFNATAGTAGPFTLECAYVEIIKP